MKLQKVIIDNFRNINHAEYDLQRVNLFTGPNMTGKTNTILAIYWAITGFLIDGSSDDESLKTIGQTNLPVSVELQFDGVTIKKQYAENWVKTRGSNELTMKGHNTDYWIDGIRVGVTEAKAAMSKKFEVAGHDTGKFDLIRSVVDPYYVGRGVDWKVLRKFIIGLCGDVKPEDIFQIHPEMIPIQERLKKDGYDEAKTTKYYKQLVKSDKDEIETVKKQIEGLNSMAAPSEDDVVTAQKAVESIDKKIQEVKSGDGYTTIVSDLETEQKEAELKLRECKLADIERANELNKKVNEQIETISAQLNNARDITNTFADAYQKAKSDMEGTMLKLNGLQLEKMAEEKKREMLYEEYDRLSAKELPEEILCPHCGKPINEEEIQRAKAADLKALDDCISRGKQTATKIENLNLKIAEMTETVEALRKEQDSMFAEMQAAKGRENELTDKKHELTASRVSPEDSKETSLAKQKLAEIQDKINAALTANRNQHDAEEAVISDLRSQKTVHQQVLKAQAAYEMAQENIKEFEKTIATLQQHLIECETALILITNYTRARLDMFKKNIDAVFNGRVDFTLIEQNIKEGSWDEVCYPLILDKSTPFADGSGSEQILTGIYIGDRIKKKLGIPDLPYVFDECDKLDGAHLAGIDTTAQLISTIVDDRTYSKVTLVATE
ncbi:MAG: hypothetical protein IKE28_12025 [Solobacterium sp.]|nr:hypothetical protein [Solobacterium sp.]